MESTKFTWAMIGSIVTPIFSFMYGEGTVAIYGLLSLATFIFLDWLSGSRAAKKDNSYASHYGIDGIIRTFFMLLLPMGGHFIDMMFGLPPIFFGLLTGGLLYHTIQSATANALRAGWGNWIPDWALKLISEWVKSEIENKVKRSAERKMARESDIQKEKQ